MSGDPYPIAGRAALWYAFLGGPIAWSAHLLVSYAPIEVACGSVGPVFFGVVTLVTLLASLGAAAVGWRAWRRAGQAGDTVDPIVVRRTRFMGLSGMILGGFFAVIILAEGMPVLIVNPCLHAP